MPRQTNQDKKEKEIKEAIPSEQVPEQATKEKRSTKKDTQNAKQDTNKEMKKEQNAESNKGEKKEPNKKKVTKKEEKKEEKKVEKKVEKKEEKKVTKKKEEKKEEKKEVKKAAKKAEKRVSKKEITAASDDATQTDETKTKKELRHFRLITGDVDPTTGKLIAKGRYSGTKPKQAANKAYTAIIKDLTEKNDNVVPLNTFTEFKIIESTRARKPKITDVVATDANAAEGEIVVPKVKKGGKKKNKGKNKGKSIYSYRGQRIKLQKEQAVTLRDKSKFLGYVTVTKEKTDKVTGEKVLITEEKKSFAPLLEKKEVEENGVMIEKMVPKVVVYNYKNDVKKLKGEKITIKADDIIEVEGEGEGEETTAPKAKKEKSIKSKKAEEVKGKKAVEAKTKKTAASTESVAEQPAETKKTKSAKSKDTQVVTKATKGSTKSKVAVEKPKESKRTPKNKAESTTIQAAA